jgi:NTE family protein
MSALGALIYKTPLGPISVSAHYYDDRNPFYIMLNIGYLMFKERPLN